MEESKEILNEGIDENLNEEIEKTTKLQTWGFKKGQSGNPNGRPVGTVSIVEGLRRKLKEIDPTERRSYLDIFIDKLISKAAKEGDVALMRDLVDRIDGKPRQSVDVTTNGKDILPKEEVKRFLDNT
jgi:hypothetical protein